MRARAIASILVLLASAGCAPTVESHRERPEPVIAQFSSPDFDTREAAMRELIAMGPEVVPAVDEAMRTTADPEVKRRCEMTLEALEPECVFDRREGEPTRVIDLRPSRVTLDMRGRPAAEVLAEISRQTGNAFFHISGKPELGKRRITLKLKDARYFDAIEALCREAHFTFTSNAYGQLWDAGEVVEGKSVCVGPTCVRMHSTSRSSARDTIEVYRGVEPTPEKVTREQDEEDGYDGSPFDPPSFLSERRGSIALWMGYFVEDRLGLTACNIAFDEVLGPDGVTVGDFDSDCYPYDLLGGNHDGSPHIILDTTDRKIDGPLTVKGRLILSIPVGGKRLTFKDVFGGREPSAGWPGVEARIVRTAHHGKRAAVHLSVRLKPNSEFPIVHGTEGTYGFRLIDPNGMSHAQVEIDTDTSGGVSRRYDAANSLYTRNKPDTATLEIVFKDVPAIDGAWTLTYTAPERVETREFPFVLKDIPLPKKPK